jgi:uncharacterized protein YqgV (UPF0045/DUF77 family)
MSERSDLDGAGTVRVEFTVEPFVDGHPGEHVLAAWRAVEASGRQLEIGPFSASTEVPDDQVGDVMSAVVTAALDGGATRVALQVERVAP